MESKIIQNSLGKLELSNCFLSWSDLKKNISDKKMEMFTEKNIVLLIEKRPLYFNMYYFIKKDAVIEDRVWTSLREDISK
ncbi:MAG TPA: hypothetical protein DHV96_12045, partial [Lachnospiraceae bacterium]|nr:hypothetical protein [Lachnospiraceae bacterium]